MMTPTPLDLFNADPRGWGRRLRRALWANETLRMLPDDGEAYGWFDGGCLELADALTAVLAPVAEVVPIVKAGQTVGDHYVTRVGRWYLDGSGAWLQATMLRRWEREELLGRHRAEWSTMDAVTVSSGTPPDAELSAHLSRVVFGIGGAQ